MPLPLTVAPKIASYAIQPPNPSSSFLAIEVSQATHRIHLINALPSITPGIRILEIGCGQGTATQALAVAISSPSPSPDANPEQGHITALDPAPPDYGRPFTLAQAQSHLSSGPLGSLITFHQADPITYLSSHPTEKWDIAVLMHCIWYFPTPTTLLDILIALKGRVRKVCIAEWALQATEPAATGHVLAAIARATFEAHRTGSGENIQTALSPEGIKSVVAQAGWKVESEGVVVPEKGLEDGFWEAGTVVSKEFLEDMEREVGDDRVKAVLRSARDATVAAARMAGGEGARGAHGVRSMDVWTATLVE
ncbi:hypothetical protein OQA88_4775 [Cercophora sp. LCS_1]